jgi:hypothetical protein
MWPQNNATGRARQTGAYFDWRRPAHYIVRDRNRYHSEEFRMAKKYHLISSFT